MSWAHSHGFIAAKIRKIHLFIVGNPKLIEEGRPEPCPKSVFRMVESGIFYRRRSGGAFCFGSSSFGDEHTTDDGDGSCECVNSEGFPKYY